MARAESGTRAGGRLPAAATDTAFSVFVRKVELSTGLGAIRGVEKKLCATLDPHRFDDAAHRHELWTRRIRGLDSCCPTTPDPSGRTATGSRCR
jgi:hypothetical protein